jgi:hypothetical protein
LSRYKSEGDARLLIGFESSGVMRRAFRAVGIDAWSCDLFDAADGSPFHIKGDVFEVLDDGWHGAIFHPTCTFLTCSAEWAYNDPDFARYPGVGYHQKVKPGTLVGSARRDARAQAIADVKRLLACNIPHKAIENPRGVLSSAVRKPDQIVQPNWFGDDASKFTCWWLEDLPALSRIPSEQCPGRKVEWPRGSGKLIERWGNQTDSGQNNLPPSEERWRKRSETYPGLARACARSWAPVLKETACLD